jgi:hypothetical protein
MGNLLSCIEHGKSQLIYGNVSNLIVEVDDARQKVVKKQ